MPHRPFYALTGASLFIAALAACAPSSPPSDDTQAIERAARVAEAVGAREAAGAAAIPEDARGAHQFVFDGLVGPQIALAAYAGKAVLVVNTASRCGFTPQYAALQALQDARADSLVVVGVPSNDFGGQEPGDAQDIQRFCELNYGVTFPMAAKSPVSGAEAHPFYQWARQAGGPEAAPQWNFHKILIGPDGAFVAAFPSDTAPDAPAVAAAIDRALAG